MSQLRPALVLFALFTVLTGLVYPAVTTGVAQLLFPDQANGSLIVRDGTVVGSSLIGQPFDDPKYFWGRPSATLPVPYNAGASSGSNLGPTNPALYDAVTGRVGALRGPTPVTRRRCRSTSRPPRAAASIRTSARRRRGFLGEPRVNVLALNLALDGK